MTKYEFMKELEENLTDIPLEERMEALQYYENYFEDAGPEQEQSLLSELGAPDKVAAGIKADLNSSEQEVKTRGYFTEKGYEDESCSDMKYEIIGGMPPAKYDDGSGNKDNNSSDNQYGAEEDAGKYNNSSQNDNEGDYESRSGNSDGEYNYNNGSNRSWDYEDNGRAYNNYNNSSSGYDYRKKNNGLRTLLIIIGCFFAIPVVLPLFAGAFGIFIAAIVTAASLWLASVIVSIALILSGVVVIIAGIIKLMTIPAVGICLAGGGLILFGIGLLFTMATVGLSAKVIPALIRWFISFCRLPFRNRRVAV
jgi:uncharacterized membrane protein